MKLTFSNSKARGSGGMMLIECMVYITIFAILLGVGFASFYLLWDNSAALRYATDDIAGALRAGETWRDDVRRASAEIQSENFSKGVLVRIPCGKQEIDYRFSDKSVWRKDARANSWLTVLSRVKTSQMLPEKRNQITVWHWDVEIMPHRARSKILQFSFEAVAPNQP